MKVLVTGAAGFIGSAVVDRLRTDGHEVLGVDAMLELAHGAGVAAPPGVEMRDVRNAGEWVDLLTGVDVVCHQAAVVGVETTAADLPSYAAHNDLGTAALLSAMTLAGVERLVLASSMVVYGEGAYACPDHGPRRASTRARGQLATVPFDHPCPDCERPLAWALVDEDAPLEPRSAYAASKVAQEHYAAAWARLTGARVVALRYHNVYGPGMPRDTPYSGVAAIFRSAIEAGRAPRVFEDGGQMRDFVHVADVAGANAAAVAQVGDAPEAGLRAYNVCSGRPIGVGTVAELLVTALGGGPRLTPVVTGQLRPGDVRHVVADPRRAARELGFIATIPPQTGIPELAFAPLR